jgi:hypothetical protein
MRNKSRQHPFAQDSTTSSKLNQEQHDIRSLQIFKVVEYIRAAIEIILEEDLPMQSQHSRKDSIHS